VTCRSSAGQGKFADQRSSFCCCATQPTWQRCEVCSCSSSCGSRCISAVCRGGCDSKVYEDSVELQSYFIQQRDELCRRGEVLLTPALNFTSQQFAEMIEDDRREQTSREQDDDERKKQTAAVKATSAQVSLNSTLWVCCIFLFLPRTFLLF